MFKLVGVILGYLLLGFWGALLGLFIGSIADRARSVGPGAINPMTHAMRQAVFLETIFIAMGKLAKADGRVSEDEIAHVEQFMQKLGMSSQHRQQAIALFKQGADPAFDLEPTLDRFMRYCGGTKDLREVVLVYLIVMAHADGHFHPAEETLLTAIARHLGYDSAAFKRLVDMVSNQAHFSGNQVDREAALDDAYKALGISRDSTDAEVKRAHRKLMSQYHPDKLMGQGVPEDMIKQATEQAKEIQLAYDLIKKSRAGTHN